MLRIKKIQKLTKNNGQRHRPEPFDLTSKDDDTDDQLSDVRPSLMGHFGGFAHAFDIRAHQRHSVSSIYIVIVSGKGLIVDEGCQG